VKKTTLLVWLLIALYAGWFASQSVLRHQSLHSTGYDLGNVDQALWNTLRGRPLYFTNWEGREDTFRVPSRLAMHVEPIYFLIAPLYWLWSDPRALLILQAVVVALGAWPAYRLAQTATGSVYAGVVFAAVYLLFPALQGAVLFDFHAVTLAAATLLFALYFLHTRRCGWFALFAVLTMACKEDMPAIVGLMGLYIFAVQRERLWGLITMGVAAIWFLVANLVVVPAYNISGISPFVRMYQHVTAVVLGRGLDTGSRIAHHGAPELAGLTRGNLFYVLRLLLPGAFLSLFSPGVLLMTLPTLAINLLSDSPNMHKLEAYHYAAPAVPLVVGSAILGTAWLAQRLGRKNGAHRSRWTVVLATVALLCSSGYSYLRGYLPLSALYQPYRMTDHARRLAKVAALVPPDAAISVQNNLNPHFTQRSRITLFPYSLDPDLLLLDMATLTENKDNIHRWIRDDIVNGDEFGLVYAEDGYLLLQRGAPHRPLPDGFYSFLRPEALRPQFALQADFGDAIRLLGFDVILARHREPAYDLYFQALRPLADDYGLHLYLLDESGQPLGATLNPPAALVWYPTSRWQPGEVIRVRVEVLEWWTGDRRGYGVALGWQRGDDPWDVGARLRPANFGSHYAIRLPADGTLLQLADFRRTLRGHVPTVPERRYEAARLRNRQEADFGGQVRLLGYELSRMKLAAGEELHITLMWQAEMSVAENYTVFVHLLDESGQWRAGHDSQPDGGLRPMTTWLPGEVVADRHRITLPPDLAAGVYQVEAGIYLPATGARLPVIGSEPPADRVLLSRAVKVR